jgi:L-lysine 2,3-aminomutase
MVNLVRAGASDTLLRAAAREIQDSLNPHPAGQMDLNVPVSKGVRLAGMQHKYRETVLFFPSQGQTCHAYCTYCFRWAQFAGIDGLRFASREADALVRYLKEHPEVTSVLFTGGDPATMSTRLLRRYIEPLLSPELEHLNSIRIGTKAPAYWPHRFLTDHDADDLLRLFEEVRDSGRHLALMAHYTHPRELETPAAEMAVRRIVETGAIVRCQSPLVRHINDDPSVWSTMWRMQIRLGAVPYYMFVERDTGPKDYFEVPLVRAEQIFREAYRDVCGLARTVRGPSMSATPGKVVIDGVVNIRGEKAFALRMLQARDPEWVGVPFYARYDPTAVWLDELRPAFGEREFFYEEGLRRLSEENRDSLLDGPASRWQQTCSEEIRSWLVPEARRSGGWITTLRNAPFDR